MVGCLVRRILSIESCIIMQTRWKTWKDFEKITFCIFYDKRYVKVYQWKLLRNLVLFCYGIKKVILLTHWTWL